MQYNHCLRRYQHNKIPGSFTFNPIQQFVPVAGYLLPCLLYLNAPQYCHAQTVASVVNQLQSPTVTAGATLPSFSTAGTATSLTTDVFTGQGNTGPFLLSWQNITPGSDIVIDQGATLLPEKDYKLDPYTGVLTLTSPLPSGVLMRVSYQLQRGSKQREMALNGLPVALSLWKSGNTQISLNSQLQPSSNPDNSPSVQNALLDVQTSNTFIPGSSLQLHLLSAVNKSSWQSGGALSALENTATTYGSLKLAYTRAGSLLAEKVPGLTAGQEQELAQVAITPSRKMTLTLMAEQTRQLLPSTSSNAGDVYGNQTSTTNSSFAYSLPTGGTINATRNTTMVQGTANTHSIQVQDTAKLQQNLPGKTVVTAAYTDNTSNSTGTYVKSATNSINLTSNPDSHISITGSLQNQTGTNAGSQQDLALKFIPVPTISGLAIQLSQNVTKSLSGSLQTRDVSLTAPLLANKVKFSGDLSQQTGNGIKQTTGTLNLNGAPNKAVAFNSQIQLRSGDAAPGITQQALNTYAMNLSLKPSSLFQMSGGYTRNPVVNGIAISGEQDNLSFQSNLGLKGLSSGFVLERDVTDPSSGNSNSAATNQTLGTFSLSDTPSKQINITGSAQVHWNSSSPTTPAPLNTYTVNLNATPNKVIQLNGNYAKNPVVNGNPVPVQQGGVNMQAKLGTVSLTTGVQLSQNLAPTTSTTTPGANAALTTGSLGLTASLLKGVDVNGQLQMHWADSSMPKSSLIPDTYALNLSLKPAPVFSLTGGISKNPIVNGVTQVGQQENVNLSANVGTLSLTTGVAVTSGLGINGTSDTDNFGLSLHITPYDCLTAGMEGQNVFFSDLAGSRTYKFGFTHTLGSIFTLSLAATMSQNTLLQTGNNQPDYGAQLQLGLHF